MGTYFRYQRCVGLTLVWILVSFGGLVAQVPRTIAFQGLLTDDQGTALATGDYGITFRLYNVPTDGAALWTEVQTVRVTDGVGNATLGRINPLTLPFDVAYYLGITLQSGSSELNPRIPLSSGPYAFMAAAVPDGAITEDKIADGSITVAKIQEGGLEGTAIADGAITPGKLADGAITAVKMGDDAVGSGAIIDASITADDLAEGAVGTDAIADGAVTPIKLNTAGATTGDALVFNGADLVWGAPSGTGVISEVAAGDGLTGGGTEGIVTLAIDADAVTDDMIAPDAVGTSELAADAVEAENILDGAVTRPKLDATGAASGNVLTYDGAEVIWAPATIADGAVTSAKIAAGAVIEETIGTDAVTTDKVADGSIGTSKLADEAVTNEKVADSDISLVKLDAGSATTDDVIRYTGTTVEWGAVAVGDGTIDSDKLADDAVTTAKIVNFAVTTDKIAASAVGSSQVSSISGQKLQAQSVSLEKVDPTGAEAGDFIGFSGGVVSWVAGPPPASPGDMTIDGNLTVTGSVEKGGGTFKIDHPLDPENRYLYHSFVESDEMMNVYSGNVVTGDDGTAWIDMPDWFEALNKDVRYQLTCIGGYAPVYVARTLENGRFQIAGGAPGLQVSWQVTAVRDDPWARQNRMRVEVEKPADEKGSLLHPDAYANQ